MIQPLVVNFGHEGEEPVERLAFDAVALGVSVQRQEADRRLTAECKILPVEPESLPSPQVEGVPRFRLRTGRRFFNSTLQPSFAGICLDEFLDPFLVFRRLPAYLPAEGAPEFFAASLTNSTRRFPTRPAHQ